MNEEVARSDEGSWVAPSFLLFAVLLALARLHTFGEPPERDITTYAVIGHELLAGRSLYTDLWDHKPPAVHLTFALAESTVGYGLGAVYLLNVGAAVLSLLGVMLAARAMGARAAMWAGGFWVAVSGDMMLQANQPNTEVFINAALVLAFALLVRPSNRPRSLSTWSAVGSLLALACLYKPIAAVTAAFFLVAGVGLSPATERRREIRGALLAASILAAAGAALFVWFAAVGSFDAFWQAVIAYNRDYQARGWEESASLLARVLPYSAWFLLPLLGLMIAGAVLRRSGNGVPWLWLAAYLAGSLISILLPGQLHAHYFQLWLPAFCIGAAWGLEELRQWRPQVARLAGIAAIGAILAYEIPSFALGADQWSERKYGAASRFGPVFVTARDLAAKVDSILLPGETFYEFGDETGFYFHSERRPPSGVLYAYPLRHGPLTEALSARLVADLEREKPELLIVNITYASSVQPDGVRFDEPPALAAILRSYQLQWIVRGRPTFFLFTRNGGALEARLHASPRPPELAILDESAVDQPQ